MLSPSERRALLELARRSIAARLRGERAPRPASPPVPGVRQGAFVTIQHRGELRGCIGYTRGDQPLADVVWRCAASASTEDPRFPPLSPRELPEVGIEISVLGPIEEVTDPGQIEIGRHGLIVEKEGHRGLLLPQVAAEWGWDRETFLDHTCLKAGLAPTAWKEGAKLLKFEAEVFSEADLKSGAES